MKAISIKQPWARLIMLGIKDIENRTWKTKYRGTILIHASKKIDTGALKRLQDGGCNYLGLLDNLETGCLLGVAFLSDCVDKHSSKWFEGHYGFVMRVLNKFENPILYKGQLGIFEVPNFQMSIMVPTYIEGDKSTDRNSKCYGWIKNE